VRFIAILTAAVMLSPAGAAAQAIEVGGSIAVSCKGSDGSFCNDSHSGLLTGGPYVSVWFADRVEIQGRAVWLNFPDLEGQSIFPAPITYAVTERSRTLLQAEATWHFRRGKRLRPMFGLGLGGFRDRGTVSCAPDGCDGSPTYLRLTGRETAGWERDISLMTGLSATLSKRFRLRAGWRYHNPFRDELALSELFFGTGFAF